MTDVTIEIIEAETAFGYHFDEETGPTTAAFDMAGGGEMAFDPTVTNVAAFAMAGSGEMAFTPTVSTFAAFDMAGSGDVAFDPAVVSTAAFGMAGSGNLGLIVNRPPTVPASGWHVVIKHPDTGHFLVPDILDEPELLPSLNSLPEIRIPIRPSSVWMDPALEDNPAMDVYLDGEKQPIDELLEIEGTDSSAQTTLVGIGATELRERVPNVEYRSKRRHEAAEDLVAANTSYNTDVDTPIVETLTGEQLQNPTDNVDFQQFVDAQETDPIDVSGGDVTVYDTAVVQEGENYDRGNAALNSGSGDYSSGFAALFTDSGDFAEWDFTLGYDIPDGSVSFQFRINSGGSPSDSMTITLETDNQGDITLVSGQQYDFPLQWIDGNVNFSGLDGLSAGDHTLRIEQTGASDTGSLNVDVICVYDSRYTYTFDNSVNTTDGYLDGPETKPDVADVVGEDTLSAFSVTDAAATLTIDDTTNNQYLQVSNDQGASYYPQDGTENNTATVDVDFSAVGAGAGSAARLKAGLSRYSPSGAQAQTPRFGYDAQTISEWTLSVDLDLELLLIDYKNDDALVTILNDIAGDEFVWSANLDANGDYQVSWTEPGQRSGSRDPDIGDVNIRKNVDIFESVTIKGSNRPISGDTFEASSTFKQLSRSGIEIGSETVYDAGGNNYDRGGDYEMDYTDGSIRVTQGSALVTGDTYQIDYRVETVGTYEVENAPANPREFVNSVPGITSDRGARQIAFVLADEFKVPRYAGDMTIPRADVGFDPLEALTLENLDLPDEATPLDIQGEPQITPQGIRLRLGSRGQIEQALGQIKTTVGQLSRRS